MRAVQINTFVFMEAFSLNKFLMKTLYLNIVHAFLKQPFIHTVLRLEGLKREPLLMTTHRLFSLLPLIVPNWSGCSSDLV